MKKKITNILPILVLIGLVIFALVGCDGHKIKVTENMHKFKDGSLVTVDNKTYIVYMATTNSNNDIVYYLDALDCHADDCKIVISEEFIKPYKQP